MRILQVCPIFPPHPGEFASGVVQVVYSISKQLIDRGHQVEVYTSNALGLKRKLRSKVGLTDGIQVHYFPYVAYYCTYFITPTLIAALKGNIEQFDVIHIHDFRTFQAGVAAHYAKKMGIPYVVQTHGAIPQVGEKRGIKKIYDILWGYRVLRNAAKVIALSPMEVEECKNIGISRHKVEIIPNGIDLSEFENVPARGQFKRSFGLSETDQVVLYLGRVHKIKGLDLLLKAFGQVSKDLTQAKLVIVGPVGVIVGADVRYLASLQKLIRQLEIEEKVVFAGPLYGVAKLEAYVDADVYVLPSRREAFGMTLVEAMACGTAVVTTETCGIAGLVNHRAGYCVPYDERELGRVLVSLLTNEGLRREMGQRGRKLVSEQFTCEKAVQKLESVYCQIRRQSTG